MSAFIIHPLKRTERGFEFARASAYTEDREVRLVQQSSAIGRYADAVDRPGSSFLWIDENLHLDRAEVAELRDRLDAWLSTGSLRLPGDPP